MFNLIRYFFAIIFLFATIGLGIKGGMVGIQSTGELQNHKKRAIYYSMATFCGLISFEIYYPILAGLICVPILLLAIWFEYLTAISLINKK